MRQTQLCSEHIVCLWGTSLWRIGHGLLWGHFENWGTHPTAQALMHIIGTVPSQEIPVVHRLEKNETVYTDGVPYTPLHHPGLANPPTSIYILTYMFYFYFRASILDNPCQKWGHINQLCLVALSDHVTQSIPWRIRGEIAGMREGGRESQHEFLVSKFNARCQHWNNALQ